MYPPTPFVGVKKVDSYLARLQRQNTTALASPFPPPQPQSLPLPLLLPFPRLELHLGPNPYPTPAPNQPPRNPPLSGTSPKSNQFRQFSTTPSGWRHAFRLGSAPHRPQTSPNLCPWRHTKRKKTPILLFFKHAKWGEARVLARPLLLHGPRGPPTPPPNPPPKTFLHGPKRKKHQFCYFSTTTPCPCPCPPTLPLPWGSAGAASALKSGSAACPFCGRGFGPPELGEAVKAKPL